MTRPLRHTSACGHAAPPPAAPSATPAQLDTAAAICHAMSDAARLRLLLALVPGERCVSELVGLDGGKLSSISARLNALHAARLVSRRREAKHVYYALADEHVLALLNNVLGHAAESST